MLFVNHRNSINIIILIYLSILNQFYNHLRVIAFQLIYLMQANRRRQILNSINIKDKFEAAANTSGGNQTSIT